MIDDEANFDNIFDASEEVQAAAKFRPKQRVKPRKTALPSRSAASKPTVENGDGKPGAISQVNSSKELTSQERTSLTCPSSEAVDDISGSQGILETASDDVLTAPLGPPDGTTAADKISQDDMQNADLSKFATHQESLVGSDIQVSPANLCGKTIDDIVEFDEIFGAQGKEERVAKFHPKVHAKLLKTVKSQKTNQKVEASTVDMARQNERGDNIQTRHVQTPDSEGLLATGNSDVGSLANLDSVLGVSVEEEPIAKFHPKLRPKPGMVSSKVVGTNDNVTAATQMDGICAENNDMLTKPKDQETITTPATLSPQDVDATVDLDYHNELINSPIDGTQSMFGEVSAEATCKSQPNVGRKKGKGKSVSFALSDASEVVTPTDTNLMGNFSDSCNDKFTDENLSNFSQQTAEKNSNDQEHNDNENQYHDEEPLDHTVEQPKSGVGEIGSSMKLRSRKKSQKVGTLKHTDDCFDEDCVEPSLAEEDNDSGDDYTAGTNRKVRKKSKDDVKESQQQKVQKDKSQVSSRGRKRTSEDASAEKPEKKLTHRIRQNRAKEVKTLLEKSHDEINPMKLSAAHLRLLQEARERVNTKENPSGPSSNTSFQLDDMDDFDYRDEEERNFDNDRTENSVQNVKKLNYHSYMNKQTRGRWSKSDTDMFYKGLRQFGSDFAMIQQLLPDKTRQQVRAKFKTEEKKNPLLVHDAIIHRSGDNLYFKTVIKNLNIDDVAQQEINNTHKQDGAPSERGPGKEDVLDDFIHGEEDDSNWLDEEHNVQKPDLQEELASGNDDDGDLEDVFDWY
ncbi:unnamed protein product [Urochloa decumbens]|uniref:Myb-like domain-containing protein n=1 Tax=Urochloa decumbens TaxID=240449 RepID=A0ABC8VCS2_9POAL